MRVTDYIVEELKKNNIDHFFTVTGGGAMFLNDSISLRKDIKILCNHHEQACAMGAVGYSKLTNIPSVVVLTTGCGSKNAITGLLDAWQDNVPVIFISGQVKKKETSRLAKTPLRQFGVQEADIVEVVKPITKFATMVTDPKNIAKVLSEALRTATAGRPGPVWIDIPLDIQGASISKIDQKILKQKKITLPKPTNKNINIIQRNLQNAKRPIVIVGNGIRLSSTEEKLISFIKKCKIPTVSSYLGIDIIDNTSKYHIGRLGIKGDRPGNFAIQNSDYVLSLGCHLSVSLTGFEYNLFARDAIIDVVDIDHNEHKKNTIKISNFIHSDLNEFFNIFNKIAINIKVDDWLNQCLLWKKKWPVIDQKYKESKLINKYIFIDTLNKNLLKNSVVISDAGSSYYVTSQSISIKKGQRYLTSGAQADMGFSLPAALGVCFADKRRSVIAITGDGSLQMNIQELQTLKHHNFNLKLIVWNNNGYLSIRATQKKFFKGSIGTDKSNGVSFPNLEKISFAFGIEYVKFKQIKNLEKNLKNYLTKRHPVIIEIFCPSDQEVIPTASSKKLASGQMVSLPLEDMYPFLDRDEFYENMIIPPFSENK